MGIAHRLRFVHDRWWAMPTLRLLPCEKILLGALGVQAVKNYFATFAERRNRCSNRRAISPNISVWVGCGWMALAT